ncbi:unnamed protein product [Peronospora belbahrii]|uniref:Uncharacterized protein n=1 Tax=Peronospora belbahrii TaxID=622444 RepID=A0AAU9LDV1_9STRA|nr:unnamed protein product [Peronospora belbahrii]
MTLHSLGKILPRWDYEMLYVEYPSLHEELVVIDYVVWYLMPRVAELTTVYETAKPVVLAWYLSDQLALEQDEKRSSIMRSMSAADYTGVTRCCSIDTFRRNAYLLLPRDRVCCSPEFVRECVFFYSTLHL